MAIMVAEFALTGTKLLGFTADYSVKHSAPYTLYALYTHAFPWLKYVSQEA